MRLRVRGPSGQSTLSLADDATISDLKAKITDATLIQDFDVKYGYPPQPLLLDDYGPTTKLTTLNIKLNGEQLIVSDRTPPASQPVATPALKSSSMPDATSQTQTRSSDAPLTLSKKPPPNDTPEIAIPSHASTMVLRVMQDDNSCMFRAFNSAYFGAIDSMTELRSLIAQYIQANREKYTEAILERTPDDYCRWIQTEDAWGGAIELDILSRHFNIEICSIDVQTGRNDIFNEGCSKRCILVYSGIHYDVIATSPSDPPFEKAYAPPDFDEKVFDRFDEEILEKAKELCKVLQSQHYFTDTASFSVRCNVCGGLFTGEKGATEHAAATGHYDFGEAS